MSHYLAGECSSVEGKGRSSVNYKEIYLRLIDDSVNSSVIFICRPTVLFSFKMFDLSNSGTLTLLIFADRVNNHRGRFIQ